THDHPAPPPPSTRKQQAEPRPDAQHRVDTAVRRFLARVVDEPRGIGLGADRLPDLLLEVRAHRPPGGAAQHQAEDLGLDRGVREPRAPGLLALVEWADGLEAAGL